MKIGKQIALLLFSALLSSESVANDGESSQSSAPNELCFAIKLEANSQECAALITRSKLSTVKLSPQIRATKYTTDIYFNNVILAPLIGGTGQVR